MCWCSHRFQNKSPAATPSDKQKIGRSWSFKKCLISAYTVYWPWRYIDQLLVWRWPLMPMTHETMIVMLIDIFNRRFWLTSTAALALSNSSSRDWFLDSGVLPHLWSLLKRPCQTQESERTWSAISQSLWHEKRPCPCQTPDARGKEKCQH